MTCPFCGSILNKVVDKRAVNSSGEIRRRRECLKCSRRFTTYERVANIELVVIKRDGHKEPYLREKVKMGIVKALEKRPFSEKADELVEKIERKIRKRSSKEIPTKLIGQMVLSELKRIDPVAYLRFASVYRNFKQVEDFAKELQNISPEHS